MKATKGFSVRRSSVVEHARPGGNVDRTVLAANQVTVLQTSIPVGGAGLRAGQRIVAADLKEVGDMVHRVWGETMIPL